MLVHFFTWLLKFCKNVSCVLFYSIFFRLSETNCFLIYASLIKEKKNGRKVWIHFTNINKFI